VKESLALALGARHVDLTPIERDAGETLGIGVRPAKQCEEFVRVEDLPLPIFAAFGTSDVGERIGFEDPQRTILGVHGFIERMLNVAPDVGGRRWRKPPLPRPELQERGDGGIQTRYELLAVFAVDRVDVFVAEYRKHPSRGPPAHIFYCREAPALLPRVQAREPFAHGLDRGLWHRAAAPQILERRSRTLPGRHFVVLGNAWIEWGELRPLAIQGEAGVPAKRARLHVA